MFVFSLQKGWFEGQDLKPRGRGGTGRTRQPAGAPAVAWAAWGQGHGLSSESRPAEPSARSPVHSPARLTAAPQRWETGHYRGSISPVLVAHSWQLTDRFAPTTLKHRVVPLGLCMTGNSKSSGFRNYRKLQSCSPMPQSKQPPAQHRWQQA